MRVRRGKPVRRGARRFPIQKKHTCVSLNTVVLVLDAGATNPGGGRLGIYLISSRSSWVVHLFSSGAMRLRYVHSLQVPSSR